MPARPKDAESLAAEFTRGYELGRARVERELEQCVLGCDYGGTSWTTCREAQRVAGLLGLRPGMRLLEVGAGSGWPGLFLAQTSGCNVTLTDFPLAALRAASKRAIADGLGSQSQAVVAD